MPPDDAPEDAAAADDTVVSGPGDVSEPSSPWAAEVPVPEPPTFDWSRVVARTVGPSTTDAARPNTGAASGVDGRPIGFDGVGVADPAADGGDAADEPVTPPGLRGRWGSISVRSRAMVATGVAVALIVAVTLVVGASGSDEVAGDATSPSGTDGPAATSPDDASLPETDTTDPDDDPTDDDPDDRDREPADDADDAAAEPGSAGSEVESGVWRSGRVELPEELRSMQSGTTVIALTSGGEYHEIDLPSGIVRSIRLRGMPTNPQLVASAGTTLVTSWDTASSWLIAADQEPVEVRIGPSRGPVTAVPGRNEFVTVQFGDSGPPDLQELRIDASGDTVSVPGRGSTNDPWQLVYAPWGERLVGDAGGVYSLGDGGARRISTGSLVGSTTRHVLVRECDESYVCGAVLIDGVTEQRRPVDLGPSYSSFRLGSPVQVAPDGRSAWYLDYDDRGPTQVIVDLDTGEQQESSGSFGGAGEIGWVWTADSSGIVHLDGAGDLQFVDRETGQRTPFAEELGGRIVALTVRSEAADVSAPTTVTTATGLRLAGLDADGVAYAIDVDTATATVLVGGDPEWFGNQRPNVIQTEDAVVFGPIDGGSAIEVARDGTSATPVIGVPSRPLLPGPRLGTVWQPDSLITDSAVFQLVDVTGAFLGDVTTTAIVPEADLLGGDGLGGLVVATPIGGVYTITSGGAARITTGGLVALGPTAAYVQECDDSALCGVVRVDRVTGERRPMSAESFAGVRVDDGAAEPTGSTVSPDGDVVITRSSPFGSGWALVDVAADSATEIPAVDAGTPIVWTPDSSVAVWLSGGRLQVYDRALGGVRTVSALPALRTFAPL